MKPLRNWRPQIDKKVAITLLIGVVLGAALFVLVRFIFNKPEVTHYHANFAVFIDGKREEFKGPGYYEEVQACSATASPKGRVHMHLPDNNIAHVHDANVTWGHFFQSVGWALGPDVLATPQAVYRTNGDRSLIFFLNGKEVPSPFNEVIGNEDVLVVSYGDGSADLSAQAEAARKPTPANVANTQTDPAACRGEEELGFWARLRSAVW